MPAEEETPGFAGAVLAGGQSRRMGTDKAFVELRGGWLITHALTALRDASPLFVVGGSDPRLKQLGAEHIADRWPGEGPLGGLVTLLGHCRAPLSVVLGCDQPDLRQQQVVALVRAVAATTGPQTRPAAVAAVFRQQERLQPLPMAITAAAAPVAETLFRDGQRSLHALLAQLNVCELPSPPKGLRDIDTRADLRRARH